MKVKIVFIVLMIILNITSNTYAKDIYSRTMRSDGVYINKCIYDDNRIDYCSDYDAKIGMELLNNPQKYSIVEEVIIYKTTKENFADKTHRTQEKISSGINLLNTIADSLRAIGGFAGIGW